MASSDNITTDMLSYLGKFMEDPEEIAKLNADALYRLIATPLARLTKAMEKTADIDKAVAKIATYISKTNAATPELMNALSKMKMSSGTFMKSEGAITKDALAAAIAMSLKRELSRGGLGSDPLFNTKDTTLDKTTIKEIERLQGISDSKIKGFFEAHSEAYKVNLRKGLIGFIPALLEGLANHKYIGGALSDMTKLFSYKLASFFNTHFGRFGKILAVLTVGLGDVIPKLLGSILNALTTAAFLRLLGGGFGRNSNLLKGANFLKGAKSASQMAKINPNVIYVNSAGQAAMGAMPEAAGTMGKIGQFFSKFPGASKLSSFSSSLGKMGEFVTKIPILGKAFGALGKLAAPLGVFGGVFDMYQGHRDIKGGNKVEGGVKMAGGALQTVGSITMMASVLAGPFAPLVAGIGFVVSLLGTIVSFFSNPIAKFITAVTDGIKSILQKISFKDMWDNLKEFGSNVVNTVSTGVSNVAQGVINVANSVGIHTGKPTVKKNNAGQDVAYFATPHNPTGTTQAHTSPYGNKIDVIKGRNSKDLTQKALAYGFAGNTRLEWEGNHFDIAQSLGGKKAVNGVRWSKDMITAQSLTNANSSKMQIDPETGAVLNFATMTQGNASRQLYDYYKTSKKAQELYEIVPMEYVQKGSFNTDLVTPDGKGIFAAKGTLQGLLKARQYIANHGGKNAHPEDLLISGAIGSQGAVVSIGNSTKVEKPKEQKTPAQIEEDIKNGKTQSTMEDRPKDYKYEEDLSFVDKAKNFVKEKLSSKDVAGNKTIAYYMNFGTDGLLS